MKKLLYLSLLLIVPLLLNAGHGRDRLNGKWVSPYFGSQIKLKVKRDHIRVKGLSRYRKWTRFEPIGWGHFEDCDGNTIRIKNIHDLEYRSRYPRQRIRFVKKGHVHHNHVCNRSCGLDRDYFNFNGCAVDSYGYDDYYNGYDNYNGFNNSFDRREWRDGFNGGFGRGSQGEFSDLSGKYFVREINDFVTIQRTSRGLRAKRGNSPWTNYRQNRNRKNEFRDDSGNTYTRSGDGFLKWKKRGGAVILNLEKRN